MQPRVRLPSGGQRPSHTAQGVTGRLDAGLGLSLILDSLQIASGCIQQADVLVAARHVLSLGVVLGTPGWHIFVPDASRMQVSLQIPGPKTVRLAPLSYARWCFAG